MNLSPKLAELFESADESELPQILDLIGLSVAKFESYVSEQELEKNDIDPEILEAIKQIRKAFEKMHRAEVHKVKNKPKTSVVFMEPVQPDAKLALVVGSKPLPRTELTKRLWEYIRKNGLQDKNKRTMINADAALKSVFNGKKKVSMFEMTKLVSKHVNKGVKKLVKK